MKTRKKRKVKPKPDMAAEVAISPACHAAMILAARVKLIIIEMEAAKALMSEEDFHEWTFNEALEGLLDAEMYLAGYFNSNYEPARPATGMLGRMLAGK